MPVTRTQPRWILVLLLFVTGLLGAADQAAEQAASPASQAEPSAAQAEQERVRALVEAGALPRVALKEAEIEAEQTRLQRTVRNTLLHSDLTVGQLPVMLEAVDKMRRYARENLARSVRLAQEGALPAVQLESAKQQAELAEKQYDLAQARAQAVREIATLARAESRLRELQEEDLAFLEEGSIGNGWESSWQETVLSIDAAFYREFGRALPVSAQGETAVHRSLGFDHRDRWDVAVHPDDPEGIFLLRLLDSWGIPYIAFRSSLPGQSTGPHIHIGPRSERLPQVEP